jgi:RNA polymerase sigma factor (sigma-70 family)
MAAKTKHPAFKNATCAALIAASFAMSCPVEGDSISSIQRYCQTSWRQAGIPPQEWDDCTQETIAELLSRVPRGEISKAIDQSRSAERRELMRSVWCVAKRYRRASQRRTTSLDVLGDLESGQACAEERLAASETLDRGLETLSESQREILSLWGDGNSIAEISAQLDVPVARVSDQKYKAVRALRKGFLAALDS